MPRSLDEQRDHDQSGVNATPPRSHPAGSMPPPAGRDADRSGVMTKRVGLYLRVSTKNGQEEQVAGAPTRKAALCARHRHIDPQRQTLWRAEWIRTFSSALDRQQFVVSSEFGRSTVAHGHPSSCRPRRTDRVVGRGPGAATHARIRRRHTKVALSAVRAHRGSKGSNSSPASSGSALWLRSGGTLRICSGSITAATPSQAGLSVAARS